MNRHYDTAEYARIAADLRRHFANCAITTDIMVGFPGETDVEFEESLAFAEAVGFAKAHVFAYSRRPGTRAADMPGQIPKAVKEERSRQMIALTSRTRAAFLQGQIGQVVSVLFESRTPDGMYEGYAENYTPVRVGWPDNLCGQICRVRIEAALDGWCLGALCG